MSLSLKRPTQKKLIVSSVRRNCQAIAAHCIDFASNDTLGLSKDPRVISAFCDAAQQYGVGSTASPVVCGYTVAHQQLANTFCSALGFEDALVFTSGYAANLAVIESSLIDNTNSLIDRAIHASMCDGLRRCAGKWRRFTDIPKAQKTDFVITESVFSTDGRMANWKALQIFCHDNSSRLIVDDAHGIGLIGERGLGAVEFLDENIKSNAIVIYPFGKAIGAQGAIVCGPHDQIDQIRQSARSFIYSTALSPALCAAASKSLELMTKGQTALCALRENIHYFQQVAEELDLPLFPSDTPIQSIVIGGNDHTQHIQQTLMDAGFHVGSMRPPTVPAGQAHLRIVLHADHTQRQINNLLASINITVSQEKIA